MVNLQSQEIKKSVDADKYKIKRAIKFRKKDPVKNTAEDEIPEENAATSIVQQVQQLGYITKVNGSVIIRLG